jgi:Na+/H+ antiporter NhaC
MMEMLRGCRRVIQSGKEEKSTSPDCVTGCIQLAAGISNFFIPAYLPYALFSRLLALVYLQVDPEAAWMLFAANIYSIVHFEEATLNWNQMAISIGLFFGGLFSACIILRLMYTGLKSLGRD